VDLVICGKQASTGTRLKSDRALPPPGIPQLTYVSKVKEMTPQEEDGGLTIAGVRKRDCRIFASRVDYGGERDQ